jgi:hypothetical protein
MNFFVKVKLLTGEKRVFQLPNDLKDGIAELSDLNGFFKGALITIPLEKYGKDTIPKLSVGKVMSAFTMEKSQYWRTRGQFVVKDNYRNQKFNKVKLYENFLKHDYPELHRSRIIRDFYRWIIRENYPATIKQTSTKERIGNRISTKERIGERVSSKIRKLGRFPTKERIGNKISTKDRIGEKVASKIRLQNKVPTKVRLEEENNL